MSRLWFSTSAAGLSGHGATVENPSAERRHENKPVPDWEAVGTAVRRLFCLDGVVEGAEPQGEPPAAAVDAVTADLGVEEERIVRDWLRSPPAALADFSAGKNWGVRNGRHRLTGVWSVRPEWELPIMWDYPDPDTEKETPELANMILDAAADTFGDFTAGRLELQSTPVNLGFLTGIRRLSLQEHYVDDVPEPLNFTWSGPDPDRYLDKHGTCTVYAWPIGDEALIVVESSLGLGRSGSYQKLLEISHRPDNIALRDLLFENVDQVTVIGAVSAWGKTLWQWETLQPWEIEYNRDLPKSRSLAYHEIGAVLWESTIMEGREGNE